ncbi:MAG: OsmC family protein [Syntrophales bacterium]|jgi:putative redox protein|nr:OsmC family protein [Syntrophales bacterium]
MMTAEDNLKADLKEYKIRINPSLKATLTWTRDLVFEGRTPQGYDLDFDADAQWGCKPTEALLLSLGGCMAIDIISILKKMRMEILHFRTDLTAERNPEPPQYLKDVEMVFHLSGKNLDPRKIDRAIALSRKTYCSVYNSLRPDLDLKIRYVLEDEASAPA